jgi:hypothetical protein
LSKYFHKSHNLSVLIYHFVCPAKYRKVIFNEEADETLKSICLEISKRYEISFFQDRNRQRSCTFSNTVISKIQCDRNNKNDKKYNCQKDI